MHSNAGGTSNLPGIGQYFKFLSIFQFIPFKWSGQENTLKTRPTALLSYWIFLGPILTALHTVVSVVILCLAVRSISANHAWGDVNALMSLTLVSLLMMLNSAVTAYGMTIARNYDGVLHLFNQIIHYRRGLKGNEMKP